MISYFLLLAPLLEIFKYVVYVMVFLCCIKYLKKMISFLSHSGLVTASRALDRNFHLIKQ
jgi:hypothetical protein